MESVEWSEAGVFFGFRQDWLLKNTQAIRSCGREQGEAEEMSSST